MLAQRFIAFRSSKRIPALREQMSGPDIGREITKEMDSSWRVGKRLAYTSYVAALGAFAVCFWRYDLGLLLSLGVAFIAIPLSGAVLLFSLAFLSRCFRGTP
jgi:hypothetical protein